MKEVGFKIRIPLHKDTTEAKKSLTSWRKEFAEMEKKQIPALHKKTKEYLKTTQEELKKTEEHSRKLGHTFSSSMNEGIRKVSEFNEKIHKTRERMFGLKEAFEATLVGGAVFWAGEKMLEVGKAGLKTNRKIKREFGAEAGDVREIAERLAKEGGLEGADAAKSLIPLARTLRDTVETGASFRGMKGKLSESQAAGLRKKNLEFGAGLIKRMSILEPGLDPEEMGRVLNDALTGPEGVRSLISSFQLSKHSRKLSEANEKGDVFKQLNADERKKYGVSAPGQRLEQGDLVSLMLNRSGYTAEAATAATKSLDFQLKSVGNSLKTVFGEIGEAMLSKFSGGMGKGQTMAERFGKFVEDHKADIEHIGESLGSWAESVASLAGYLPRIGAFVSEYKTPLIAVGAAFYGLKAMSALGAKLPGEGGGLAKTLGGGTGPIPVYVTNMGGGTGSFNAPGAEGGGKAGKIGKLAALSAVFTAASTGYAIGSAADEYFGISDKISNGLTSGKHAAGERAATEAVKAADAARLRKIQELEAKGIAHGLAVYQADHPQAQVINLNVDGRTLAKVTLDHAAREIKNKTGGGAAPSHAE